MNTIDIIIIAILVLFTVIGWRKGLIHSVLGIVYSVLSLALSFLIYPFVHQAIGRSAWVDRVKMHFTQVIGESLERAILDEIASFGERLDAIALQPQLKEGVLKLLDGSAADTVVPNPLQYGVQNSALGSSFSGVAGNLADTLLNVVLIGLTIALIFALFRILFSLIGKLFKPLVHLPVIRQVNYLGGALFGVLQGCLFLYFIMFIAALFSIEPGLDWLFGMIRTSYLAAFFYENNVILYFLTGKISA